MAFNRVPDQRMINQVVAVDEHVAKGDDLAVVADACRYLRIALCEAL